ncbi:MATE family efflux transporter [Treponema parvum]|uniref:MATE family efflux transporter n=1 Tax=Treponema parvum TaxID=138851 RepID=A0A975F285_9SPIR|nr:MATE family efflux transporter [Treponema parvum]QTQ13067.1 MATE family efflux transporter [Treponema parvum]
MTKDLTRGSPLSLILGFSIPALLGYLFQQFYNLVDTVIVGKFLGIDALAAVGSTGSVNFLIIGFVTGLCSGLSIPIAQKFGAKDYRTMRQFVANAGYLSVIFSFFMTAVTVIFCRPLLILMLTPHNILDRAANYILIIFYGIPFVFLYNIVSGIIRAMGDSKTPVYFLLFSSAINIGLDLFFICFLHTDVEGASLATVISQAAAGVACLFYMKKKFKILNMTKDDRRIRTHHFTTLCGTGVPMGLQYSITAVGTVVLQAAVNTLGSGAVAAITAGSRIGAFFCTPFDALGTTMATYAGQNTGAGKLDRLKTGMYSSNALGFAYSVLAFLVMLFFGKELTMLFLNKAKASILEQSQLFLIVNSASYILLTMVNVIRFTIQGMGFSKFAIYAGVLEMFARSFIGIVFVPIFGFAGACFASPAAWLFADFFLVPAFYVCLNKLRLWEEKHDVRRRKTPDPKASRK